MTDKSTRYENGFEAAYQELRKAGDALSFAAQTSGGVAGRDEGLVTTIEGWRVAREKAVSLFRIEKFEPPGTIVSAGCPGKRGSMTDQTFYGWYDDATQPISQPSFEPPRNAPCPFCGIAIHADDVRTHSLMYSGQYAARSYFYRTHRTCAEADSTGIGMDDFILDMIKRNGD